MDFQYGMKTICVYLGMKPFIMSNARVIKPFFLIDINEFNDFKPDEISQ
jgi:hypothetical protein